MILVRMSGIELRHDFKDSYTDKQVPGQEKFLSVGEYLGIIDPKKTNNKFHPTRPVTRNEMVKMIVELSAYY